jgi:hypothetical protein
MNGARYVCCDERRRALLARPPPDAPANVSGIDYIVVLVAGPTTTIEIVLVKPLSLAAVPDAAISGANIRLTGGVRFPAPRVDPTVARTPAAGTVERYTVTISGDQPTDFSTYQLAIVTGPNDPAPPAFIDPRLSEVDFSFKIACPSDFDCAPDCDTRPAPLPPEPGFDYRVRDFQGFRRQILDRLSELVPGFREDDPVDFTTTLVEAAAYRADQQSYRLDWVGTEAFLSTARSRTSVARHARLVDYPVDEGASARVFARFIFKPGGGVADGTELKASTPLLVRSEGLPAVVPAADYRRTLAHKPTVFETVAPLKLWQWRNAIAFHTWSDDECRLAEGATAATVVDRSGGAGALATGDLVLLAETASPETGDPDDARADRRHIVRLTRVTPATDVLNPLDLADPANPAPSPPNPLKLVTVEWAQADAMPFDLIIQTRLDDQLGGSATKRCAEAAANVMLADHGTSAPPAAMLGLPPSDVEALRPTLTPATPIDDESWRPVLDRADIARVAAVDLKTLTASAATLAAVDRARCLPALVLEDDFATWTARRDLLESSHFSRDFVIETGIDGRATFRFGDGVNGLAPAPGTVLVPSGRFGSGPGGNIGIGALAHAVLPLSQQGANLTVTNPLPGRGGAAPESISAIRIGAPQAFRRQQRAVTAADYAEAAMRHDEVSNAVAIPRWTGAWQTILVFVDRKGGLPVNKPFQRALLEHLEFYRLMGFDVALRGAVAAPLEIELLVCAKRGELRSTIAARVRDALRPSGGGSGERGFFHADRFTFGSPLYLSRLVAAVMAVEGVQSVTPHKFQRLGRASQNELFYGVIRPGDLEVLQLEDDPSFPEKGKLTLLMGGGR